MIKALMFGGAFNPPTNAHIELASYACRKTHRDCAVFVPSQMHYIEDDQHKSFAFDNDTRFHMLQKIAEHKNWMAVSDHEIRAKVQPRSYFTLQYLKTQGYDCSLLFGSDKLPELEHGWLYIEEIAHEYGIVCMERSHENVREIIADNPYLRTLQPYIEIVETPEKWQDISSSQVRRLYLQKKYEEIDPLIPPELNGLRDYGEGEQK